MKDNKSKERIIFGIILIVIGLLFFLNEQPYWSFRIDVKWEFIFIFVGVLIMWLRENKSLGGIFIFIGLVSLLPHLWPLILIFLGLLLIFKNNNKKNIALVSDNESEELILNETVIFGNSKKNFSSNNFKGGVINSIFGGTLIDISDTVLANKKQTIEINVIFGGAALIVPKDWNIEIQTSTIFSDLRDMRNKHRDFEYIDVDYSKTLIIKGFILFGGGEINWKINEKI